MCDLYHKKRANQVRKNKNCELCLILLQKLIHLKQKLTSLILIHVYMTIHVTSKYYAKTSIYGSILLCCGTSCMALFS